MIWTVVLAAGASTRMAGRGPKALLPAGGGDSFVARIARTARDAGSAGVVVVAGPPHGDEVLAALPPGAIGAINPRPERGMLSSVQTGIAALPAEAIATLVWPVDLPDVRVETVRAILAESRGALVIPRHGARGGHPIRIPRDRFAELLALDPGLGLRALVDAQPAAVTRLSVDDPAVLTDIDTPEDLARRRSS
jgi:CTP:molybdopterin cytidylyltransferase MocA